MDIVQTFYDNMAPKYDKLFLDRDADALQVSKFDCEYRCVRREELSNGNPRRKRGFISRLSLQKNK